MHLLLIRHGETVDNVGGKYAGHTDSALTAHGSLQARRLGAYLAGCGSGGAGRDHAASTAAADAATGTGTVFIRHSISHIFASDLQRAVHTAEAVRDAQIQKHSEARADDHEHDHVAAGTRSTLEHAQEPLPAASQLHVHKLVLLREKNFGSWEGRRYNERPKDREKRDWDAYRSLTSKSPSKKVDQAQFQPEETREAMRQRCENFVDGYLYNVIESAGLQDTVVVVAHGIILLQLWRCLLGRFDPACVSLNPEAGVEGNRFGLEYLGAWSNTGVWELEIKPVSHEAPPKADGTCPSTLEDGSEVERSTELEVKQASGQVSSALQSPKLSSAGANPHRTFTNHTLTIRAVNSTAHLAGLRKMGGGLGNVKHDASQQKMESFFQKRRKLE